MGPTRAGKTGADAWGLFRAARDCPSRYSHVGLRGTFGAVTQQNVARNQVAIRTRH
jgi:hypothetical protein